MSFTSIAFAAFLPLVFAIYWILQRKLFLQNTFLLLSSYIFYGWWDWRFLILIAITSLSSFYSGLLLCDDTASGSANVGESLSDKTTNERKRRLIVASNIILNIGILAVFKYYNFFVDSLQALLSSVNICFDIPTIKLILPVGISFYTFQSLSYTIDVYRRKLQPTRDIVAFCAFISFFPQLVAGPIERATNLLPQMMNRRKFDYASAVDGCRQILWGFFKKMVIADNCALAVDQIWGDIPSMSGATLIAGALLFTFQIYCDFSGYSDIAIGTARLFGFSLMQNFHVPYFSRNIPEFWRRWHISLMTWFRDYVYIPLGGNRNRRVITLRNTLIVFALSGLWHGANWTFIAWGLYHALLFIPFIFIFNKKKETTDARLSMSDITKMSITFALVAIGWIIFRAKSLNDAASYIYHIAMSLPAVGTLHFGKTAFIWIAIMLLIDWKGRKYAHPLQMEQYQMFRILPMRWGAYIFFIIAIVLFRGEATNFIYFQF